MKKLKRIIPSARVTPPTTLELERREKEKEFVYSSTSYKKETNEIYVFEIIALVIGRQLIIKFIY